MIFMFPTNSSIQWFCISCYLSKPWFPCQMIPWDIPKAKDKCSLAFEICDLTTLSLGLFWAIRLGNKCDAAYCGLKIFCFQNIQLAITSQKYTSKSHWPHKSIVHMTLQCPMIIWVIALVTNACCLKGQSHKVPWSWKPSLHSVNTQPRLTLLHSLNDYWMMEELKTTTDEDYLKKLIVYPENDWQPVSGKMTDLFNYLKVYYRRAFRFDSSIYPRCPRHSKYQVNINWGIKSCIVPKARTKIKRKILEEERLQFTVNGRYPE